METAIRIFAIILCLPFLLAGCASIEEPLSTTSPATTPATLLETLTTETEDETETGAETEEPAPPKEMKVLLVGNSFSYYFVEELHEMAAAVGIDMTVANLYKSGCRIDEHWEWYQNKTPDKYHFYVTDKSGRNEIKDNRYDTINEVLTYMDWDVIHAMQYFNPANAIDTETALATCGNVTNLLNAFRRDCPDARIVWHQHWAFQVGYEKYTGVADVAKQTLNYNSIREACHQISRENDVILVPTGDAWQIARADSRVGDTLCARIGYGENNVGDFYHDGDIGGGQYLNACVFFEMLTYSSCVGNTYRPSEAKVGRKYDLSEEKIAALQEAAHKAVSDLHGEDYYH